MISSEYFFPSRPRTKALSSHEFSRAAQITVVVLDDFRAPALNLLDCYSHLAILSFRPDPI